MPVRVPVSFALGFLALFLVDQLTKIYVQLQPISLIPLYTNPGISFGIFDTLPTVALFFSLAFFILLIFFLFKATWQKYPMWAGVFFGGAASNMMDRVVYGGVHDWIALPLQVLGSGTIHNNIADWGICLAVLAIFAQEIKHHVTFFSKSV